MLLVDAANVIGSRPDGWWRDRPGAARRLVDEIIAATAAASISPPVVVVLEGVARRGVPEGDADGIRVVHARGSGDDTIVELTAGSTDPVRVVSADRGLTARVRDVGGEVLPPGWLLDRLAL